MAKRDDFLLITDFKYNYDSNCANPVDNHRLPMKFGKVGQLASKLASD